MLVFEIIMFPSLVSPNNPMLFLYIGNSSSLVVMLISLTLQGNEIILHYSYGKNIAPDQFETLQVPMMEVRGWNARPGCSRDRTLILGQLLIRIT